MYVIYALPLVVVQDELERIFSCSLDGCVKVWDAYDLCCLRTLNLANKGEISCFTYLPLNMMLAVGACLFDASLNGNEEKLPRNEYPSRLVHFSMVLSPILYVVRFSLSSHALSSQNKNS